MYLFIYLSCGGNREAPRGTALVAKATGYLVGELVGFAPFHPSDQTRVSPMTKSRSPRSRMVPWSLGNEVRVRPRVIQNIYK